MCGISGIFSPQKTASADELLRMTQIIQHRGPDGEGFVMVDFNTNTATALGSNHTPEIIWQANTAQKPTAHINQNKQGFHVALAHRRLSIIDLSANGHQPLCSHNQRFWITYNGEVYNFIELRQELQQTGYTFTSDTDTEVILHAYQAWGIQCLHKFMGMFAFAIYDTQTNELFMARDRFGIKPLYYYTSHTGNFYFASEIKQFFETNNWKAQLNPQQAYDYLFYSLTDHTEETLYQGVFHLPPGCYFKTNLTQTQFAYKTKIAHTRWYHLNPTPIDIPYKQACNTFLELFQQSVAQHLRADVPVGSALSGGLDSSSIVCEVNRLLKQQSKTHLQKTFSSVATDERFSEKKWIDEVVKATGVDAHFVYPGPERLADLTPKLLWYMDEPYQSQSAYLGYHVFEEAKKQGVKVLLNGQGADEYLSGYTDFKRLRRQQQLLNGAIQPLYKELKAEGYSTKAAYQKMFGLFAQSLLPFEIKQQLSPYSKDHRQMQQLINLNALGNSYAFKHPLHGLDIDTSTLVGISKMQLFHTSLPKYLRWEDRNSMANSIEARVPFLDHRLVEFTLSLPLNYLTKPNHTPKPLLSDALENVLPPVIANRRDKKGFITPEENWIGDLVQNDIFNLSRNSLFKHDELDAYNKLVIVKHEKYLFIQTRVMLFNLVLNIFSA